jgi:hypothetical protein
VYLNLQGLGRLESARIDLSKSLIIFVGRNNTSKSYVAHTIYALHRFGAMFLAESVHALVHEQKLEQTLPRPSDVWHHEISIVDLLLPQVPRFIRGLEQHLRTQLPKVFATDDQFFSTTRVELQLAPDEESSIRERLLAQDLGYSFGVEDWQVSFRKPAGSDTLIIDCQPAKPSGNGPSKTSFVWMPGAIAMPTADLLRRVLLPGCTDPFILSTERSAIQLFSRELYGNRSRVIDDIYEGAVGSLSQLTKETRFYPLAIRDELRFINGLPRQKHVISPLAPLAARLETLLGGTVVLDESGDLMYQPAGLNRPLALHVSASSVKSLAGLAFYLRHMAPRDGFLVIDEPELNLHPDNQRSIARILAEIARAGVHVLISTHSDYVIRELSNLIALHPQEAATLREKHGYSESETLDAASVGAYLFEQTSARAIDVAAAGIEVDSIDNEINAMNRVAKDIYFNLQSKPTPT